MLAPSALTVNPGVARFEFAGRLDRPFSNYDWLAVGLTGRFNAVEIEGERSEFPGQRTGSLSLQYSITGNGFTDIAPALSVGVRDVLNSGREGRAYFAAVTKRFGLSESQERVLREWRLEGGLGTNRLDGPFFGVVGRFTIGFTASAEYLDRRLNASIGVPVGKHVTLRAYSLNGQMFYGGTLKLVK